MVHPPVLITSWIESLIRGEANARAIAAECRDGIVKVVTPVEVGHVRSPQASDTGHVLYGPFRKVGEYIAAEAPVDQVFRTSNRNSRACRKQVEGVSILDDAWIVDLANVPLELCGLREWLRPACDDQAQS